MGNLREASMNHCRPEEVFLVVDGDDELLGKQVFKLFNVFYNKGNYVAYANFLKKSSASGVGYSRAYAVNIK